MGQKEHGHPILNATKEDSVMYRIMIKATILTLIVTSIVIPLDAAVIAPVRAAQSGGVSIAPGLVIPRMDAERGKTLFARMGCVVCHSINGVGGTDAPALDAKTMDPVMNPFDFFAKMWRGAQPMIMMQGEELGGQIEFNGQDLADIVAFVHNAELQKSFSEEDIPEEIKEHMGGE